MRPGIAHDGIDEAIPSALFPDRKREKATTPLHFRVKPHIPEVDTFFPANP